MSKVYVPCNAKNAERNQVPGQQNAERYQIPGKLADVWRMMLASGPRARRGVLRMGPDSISQGQARVDPLWLLAMLGSWACGPTRRGLDGSGFPFPGTDPNIKPYGLLAHTWLVPLGQRSILWMGPDPFFQAQTRV